MSVRLILLVVMLLLFVTGTAQNDTVSPGPSLRLIYNNDTFTYSDRYYSHGLRIDYSHALFRKFPTRFVLPGLRNGSNTYGFSFVQDVFTPTSIERDYLIRGDRPYAAYMYLGSWRSSANAEKRFALTTELDAGVIGQWACGYQTQAKFHKMIGDKNPLGWDNQIDNDLVLNYSVIAEKGLLRAGNVVDVIAIAELNAGTLYDNASGGGMLRLGKLNDHFSVHAGDWQAWVFAKGAVRAVAYNATLQGGIFSPPSATALAATEIERVLYTSNAGIVLGWRNIEAEYSHFYLSPEFKTGFSHRWGRVGVRLRM